jgi:hypothetical protein
VNPMYSRTIAIFNSVIAAGSWPACLAAAITKDWTLAFVPLASTGRAALPALKRAGT